MKFMLLLINKYSSIYNSVMIKLLTGMDDNYLKGLIAHLENINLKIEKVDKINYGVQLTAISNNKKEYKIRVYQNSKGKITLDASLIKDDEIRLSVLEYNGEENPYPLVNPPLIGTDEAGKGDYFGPLCVCAFYADEEIYLNLKKIGVKDSKTLNDKQIKDISEKLKVYNKNYSIVKIGNKKFNEFYDKTSNINAIMGWAHATAVKNVLKNVNCKNVLTDKYGSEHWLTKNLNDKSIFIQQYPKAEQNLAVAAASILARNAFVKSLDELSRRYNMRFPLGAGASIDDTAVKLILAYGDEVLIETAKVNFKNTERILQRVKNHE